MTRILGTRVGRVVFALLLVAGVATAVALSVHAYSTTAEEPAATSDAGRVEAIAGTDEHRVILTEQAAARLGIKTGQIQYTQVNGQQKLTIPYSAVLYDTNGGTWVYTSPEPQVFVRQQLTIDRILGELATVSAGPAAGTTVVSVGAPELFGTEFGVGGDE
jgi:hypothetical protein